MVLLCNKWSTLSSPTGLLNVLSRKCNETAFSTFQSSAKRRKNYPYSLLLLHRQGRAAKWKHFLFAWKSSGRSSSFPWYQGHFIKLCNTSVFIALGLSRILDTCSCCSVTLQSGHSLAGSRSETPINWDTWIGRSWETCGRVNGWGCNRRLGCLGLWNDEWTLLELWFLKHALLLSASFAIVCYIHFLHSFCTTDQEIHLRFWA